MINREVISIVFSDLHLENWKNHNEGNRRLENAKDVLKKIALLCKKYRAISLFAGDLYHKEKVLTNEILSQTLPLFSKLWGSGNFTTVAITGNHDQSKQNLIGNESPSYINTLSQVFKGLKCIDFKSYKIREDIIVYGIPYITHDLGLVDYINNIELDKHKSNILMLHTTLPNAKDTDGSDVHSNLPQTEFYKALGRFDLVICGHIHSPFTMGIGKTNVIQVGAPQQQRLTDRNCDMGYWVIYNDLSYEFVPFKKYPRFVEISDLNEKLQDNNFYVLRPKRIKLKDSTKERKSFDNTMDRTKLAKNYCVEKGIKDKDKRIALTKALKQTEQ